MERHSVSVCEGGLRANHEALIDLRDMQEHLGFRDIPLQLVVYARGKTHRFKGVGLPIFRWWFADSGTRVAYGQEPVQFGCATHYELRDIESGRLVEAVDVPQPCGQIPDPKPVEIPDWIARVTSRK